VLRAFFARVQSCALIKVFMFAPDVAKADHDKIPPLDHGCLMAKKIDHTMSKK
jgi:hypothetical protein